MRLHAISGATVIDGTGRAPMGDAVVLIEDDRIRSVAPAAQTVIPEQAKVIDARGRYVIPGLLDANVHLFFPLPEICLEYEGRYEDLIEEAAQLVLRSGVTTVFDTWGPLESLSAVRDRINRGETVGSRIFVAGNIIGLGGPLSHDFFSAGNAFGPDTVARINRYWEQGVGPELLWLGPEEVRRRVRAYVERSGIDFVKYAASGHKEPQFILFSAESQRAIVAEGHRGELTVQAHTTTPESLRMEIEAGADILQHGDITGREPIPEQTLQVIVDRALPVAALVATKRHMGWARRHGSASIQLIHNETQERNDQRLIEAKARLLLTTDGFVSGPRITRHPLRAGWRGAVDNPIELGESHFRWLEAVIERGMAPMDALLAATRDVAAAYGKQADLGTIGPGKRADLLILDADPLVDVRNYRSIRQVIKDGVPVDRDTLPIHRILTEAADARIGNDHRVSGLTFEQRERS
jgi:imidazolonepropionase-like amidohydrolase